MSLFVFLLVLSTAILQGDSTSAASLEIHINKMLFYYSLLYFFINSVYSLYIFRAMVRFMYVCIQCIYRYRKFLNRYYIYYVIKVIMKGEGVITLLFLNIMDSCIIRQYDLII